MPPFLLSEAHSFSLSLIVDEMFNPSTYHPPSPPRKVYLGGQPYVRRDLAAPATSLHHAGVRGDKIGEMEAQLKDVRAAEPFV